MRSHKKLNLMCGAAALLMGMTTIAAIAQENPGQAGQAPGARRGGVRFGQGGRMGNSLADMPVSVLAGALKLTPDQKTKISGVQDKFKADTKDLRIQPTPGGERPDPEKMRENFQKMRDLRDKANKEIEAVLTDDQKKQLPDLMKEMRMYSAFRIPMTAVGDLKLTDDQKSRLAGLAKEMQEKTRESFQSGDRTKGQEIQKEYQDKAMALMTDEQKAVIKKSQEDMPRRGSRARNAPVDK